MSSFDVPLLPGFVNPDATLYANGIAEIRQRIRVARDTIAQVRAKGEEDVASVEVIFLQIRKCCELIAFGSLIANREIYSEQYTEFAQDWRLKKLVERLRKLNPEFFPVPTTSPTMTSPGHYSVGPSLALYITADELVSLYDTCGRILHSRNPFSTDDPTRQIRYSVDEWLTRIEGLLRWHYITQIGKSRWLVEMPETGNVCVHPSVEKLT